MYERGYENNIHKRELDKISKAEVIKVGRRHVTVDTDITTKTFDSQEDFKICHGYKRMKQGLYLSEKDYLMLISKAENAVINRAGDSVFTGQAKEVIVNLAKLKCATGKAKKGVDE